MAKSGVSLSEVHRSVSIPVGASMAKRMFAFFGPAYLISVGYMDPGNWATDLEGRGAFRIHVDMGPADVQHDGGGVADPVCETRHRCGKGSRTSLSRQLSSPDKPCALDSHRDSHCRMRSCRSARHHHRTQSALRYPLDMGRNHHCA